MPLDLDVAVCRPIADRISARSAEGAGCKPKSASHSSRRGSVCGGTISVAASIFLILASPGQAQSRSGALLPGGSPGAGFAVEPQLIRNADARKPVVAYLARPDAPQSRNLDSEAEHFYDVIMQRAGVPLRDLR